MTPPNDLPTEQTALVFESTGSDLAIKTVPIPQPIPGSAVVKVEHAWVVSYHREVHTGTRPGFELPKSTVSGASSVGRVVTTGPDATSLKPGQLVFVDCFIQSRDDPEDFFLNAITHGATSGSRRLCKDVWGNGSFAGYVRAPLEKCIPLNETKLCKQLGYTTQQLVYLAFQLVPFGGLRDLAVQPGDTVVVSPATGGFSGAGVQVALALGARVIAMGRNEKELERLKATVNEGNRKGMLEAVKITGDEAAETAALRAFGPVDAIVDLSPPEGRDSSHLRAAIMCLRRNGRVSMMGCAPTVFPVDPWTWTSKNIMLKGKMMYEREDMLQLVRMLEAGLFSHGADFVDAQDYRLQDWKKAFKAAAEHKGMGRLVTISPST